MKKCEGDRKSKRNAEAGTYNGQFTVCPANCYNEEDCPYCRHGICHIDDPFEDCDDWCCVYDPDGGWNEWEAL